MLRDFSPARAFWLWFGGIFLFVGLVFLPVGIWTLLQERAFSREGVVVEGIVLTKGINRADDDNDTTDYWITYRFTTEDGQVVEGRDTVSVHTWESLEERGPVEVSYLPDSPSRNRVGTDSDWILPAIFLGFSLVLVPVGGFFFVKGLTNVLRIRRLRTEGRQSDGTVTDILVTNFQVNGVAQWQIHYSYTDDFGQTYQGTSGYLSPEEASTWKVGETGTVRYDPRRPEDSVWIGRA